MTCKERVGRAIARDEDTRKAMGMRHAPPPPDPHSHFQLHAPATKATGSDTVMLAGPWVNVGGSMSAATSSTCEANGLVCVCVRERERARERESETACVCVRALVGPFWVCGCALKLPNNAWLCLEGTEQRVVVP